MRKSGVFLCFILLVVIVFLSGCTSPGPTTAATPTPTSTPAPTPIPTPIPTPVTTSAISEPVSSQAQKDLLDDTQFITALNNESILDDCMKLLGSCDAYVNSTTLAGYRTGCDQDLARLITLKLQQTPHPASPKLVLFRSMMMDAIGVVEGKSSDKSRLTDRLIAATAVFSEYSGKNITISTPEPTPFYTPSPTPTSALSYLSLTCTLMHCSGNGNAIASVDVDRPRSYVIHMNYTGQNEFVAKIADNKGYFSLLANELGPYSGEKPVQLGSTSRTYNITITASGPWTIDIL